jgi:hypothetical protein
LAKSIQLLQNIQLQEWRKSQDAQSVIESIDSDAQELDLPIPFNDLEH